MIDKAFLSSLPLLSGIYKMLDKNGDIIYVGKAKNIQARVKSYFLSGQQSQKTQRLVQLIESIEVTITASETEALILESHLIKSHKPRFNILLRDDKSYPYIFVSTMHAFPRIDSHRGAKRLKGEYYGPYPNATAVRETLNWLQKLFKIRQCRDSFFESRTRPCLQYQIHRCTAPCVGYVTESDYAKDVAHALLFLEGKNQDIINELIDQMQEASARKAYEQAAALRDLITHLRTIQEQQYVTTQGKDTDVISIAAEGGVACVAVMTIRAGRLLGSKSYYPKSPPDAEIIDILQAFLSQYYLNDIRRDNLPTHMIVSEFNEDIDELAKLFSDLSGKTISIQSRVRGERAKWLKMAKVNAEASLKAHLSAQATIYRQCEGLEKLLHLQSIPQRIECFDISHSQGEATVASCVVFDIQGPKKTDYRRYHIKDITPGDDYAAMYQALMRRYREVKKGEGVLPDVIIIDGGKGQIKQAKLAIEECQLIGVTVVGISKGEGRKAEYDKLLLENIDHPVLLQDHPIGGYLIQQIRDEAHRFAITGHRGKRDKARTVSLLDDIEGVGAKRKQALLGRFGSVKALSGASVEEIAKVPGVSLSLAQQIYDKLHVL